MPLRQIEELCCLFLCKQCTQKIQSPSCICFKKATKDGEGAKNFSRLVLCILSLCSICAWSCMIKHYVASFDSMPCIFFSICFVI